MRLSQLQLIETVCGSIVQLAWLMHVVSCAYALVMETKQPMSSLPGRHVQYSHASLHQGTICGTR